MRIAWEVRAGRKVRWLGWWSAGNRWFFVRVLPIVIAGRMLFPFDEGRSNGINPDVVRPEITTVLSSHHRNACLHDRIVTHGSICVRLKAAT